MDFDNTRVIINLDTISENFDAIRARAGVPTMAVVKADAYGHGAVQVARQLQDTCSFFCVSSILEAMELREAGLATPILILGHTPVDAFPTAIRENIRPTIYRLEDAEALSDTACAMNLPARFHFAVDTGMSRIGFQVTEADADICARIAALPGLVAEGLCSHFATADCADLTRAQQQAQRFAEFDAMLRTRGVEIPIRHLNNSAGLMNFKTPYEMVRSGIITSGMYPSDEVDRSVLPLRPALQWLSRVTHVKTLPAGREISYGGTYATKADTVAATIPVGYADGYRRNLSGKFYVLIRGQKAPILGRICMDQMMVDVTHIPGAEVGDRVTLVGQDGDQSITIEEISAMADSFNYEYVCGISRRVPRLYVHNGKVVRSVHYLLDTVL